MMGITRGLPIGSYLKVIEPRERAMNAIAKTFATATLAIALIGTTLALTPSSAETGPRDVGGIKSVSGLDLGSGR